MTEVRKLETVDGLVNFKEQYVQMTTAPLDGMWLCGFVPMATHFGFYEANELVGFFCVNDEGYLLQFFVNQEIRSRSTPLFESLVDGEYPAIDGVKGAFVSTAEPHFLSLCLDRFSNFEVNALMYELEQESRVLENQPQDNAPSMNALESAQLQEAIEFAVATIGAPREWLDGYYTNLINRQELFGVWESGRLVATGESRGYDEYQAEYADVGVMVAESQRGRGMATQILKQLVTLNEAKGLKSICSTEKANLAAQKAIARAGFSTRNRIIQLHS